MSFSTDVSVEMVERYVVFLTLLSLGEHTVSAPGGIYFANIDYANYT